MLTVVEEVHIKEPVYLEANFEIDNMLLKEFRNQAIQRHQRSAKLVVTRKLDNRHKTVGGQFAIDIERMLQHENFGKACQIHADGLHR